MPDPSSPHFLLDLEVQDLRTVDHDALARSVLQGIELAPVPFRIALFGPWGSGKSTILKLLQEQLNADESAGHRHDTAYIKTTWFNPWEHESDQNLLLSMVSLLATHIPDGVRYSRKGAKVIQRVARSAEWIGRRWDEHPQDALHATLSHRGPGLRPDLLAASGDDLDRDPNTHRVEAARQAFQRFVDFTLVHVPKQRPRRLVVVIDDLDKCLPGHVLTFLEGLKLFFGRGTPVVFVFALDRDVLNNAIEHKYGQHRVFDTDRYIEKIFEFSYEVPPITISQLKPLVGELYERAGLRDCAADEAEAGADLAALERVMARSGFVLNPRKIKRIFNKFIWFFAARPRLPIDPEGDDAQILGEATDLSAMDTWLTWVLTTEYWRGYRALVSTHGEDAVAELCNRVTGNPMVPHGNPEVRAGFDALHRSDSLIEYYRPVFDTAGVAHLSPIQARLRARVRELVRIDRVLRINGI